VPYFSREPDEAEGANVTFTDGESELAFQSRPLPTAFWLNPTSAEVLLSQKDELTKRSKPSTLLLSHGQRTWRSTLLGLGVTSPRAEAIEELR
jgi:hypothetical protein